MTTKLEQQPLVQELAKNLQRMGIALRCFDTPEEAADYLDGAIDGVSVGHRRFDDRKGAGAVSPPLRPQPGVLALGGQ